MNECLGDYVTQPAMEQTEVRKLTCGAFPGKASCLHTSVDKARSPTLLIALHRKSTRLMPL